MAGEVSKCVTIEHRLSLLDEEENNVLCRAQQRLDIAMQKCQVSEENSVYIPDEYLQGWIELEQVKECLNEQNDCEFLHCLHKYDPDIPSPY